jgi:hypothetical protein
MYQKNKTGQWEDNFNSVFALQNTSSSIPVTSAADCFTGVSLAFTPTTLSLLEKTFVDFNSEIAPQIKSESAMWGASNRQDFSDCSEDSDNTMSSLDWGVPSEKRSKSGGNPREYREAFSNQLPRKLPGPRPAHTDDELTAEEMQRRIRRRERNKMAATKCRQRRIDQTSELLIETKSLEDEAQKLEKEIENLQKQKQQLEFVLQAHQPLCCTDVKPVFSSKVVELSQKNKVIALTAAPMMSTATSTQAVRPNSFPISTFPSQNNFPVSSSQDIFVFNIGSTSATPLNAIPTSELIFSSADMMTPSSYMLSPSLLLAQ